MSYYSEIIVHLLLIIFFYYSVFLFVFFILVIFFLFFFFFSSRRRHTRSKRDWSSDVCSSDLTSASRPCAIPSRPSVESSCASASLSVDSACCTCSPVVYGSRPSVWHNAPRKIGRASCRERV